MASEIGSLLEVSARLGGEPLLVQAATGNTSIKLDGILWIKASGKWLAHATRDEILIPVCLAEARRRVDQNQNPAGETVLVEGKRLGTSVETAMHAVLPHRVVLHVHSVNTIAWAVRHDGRGELARRLEGIDWQWVPYFPSGLALAHGIQATLDRAPRTNVLVLANHGLVVCGEDSDEAEALLREVERRVAVEPRPAPQPGWSALSRMSEGTGWRVPQCESVHALGTDVTARTIFSGGVLYPCQAIFLTSRPCCVPGNANTRQLRTTNLPFIVVEDAGVLVRQQPNPTELATLAGLAQVLQRIPEDAPVQYLGEDEVRDLLCADVYQYRQAVEGNGRDLAFAGSGGARRIGRTSGTEKSRPH